MTTRRSHSCNLCRGDVLEGTGVGLVWTTNREFRFTTPGQAETHICQPCIAGFEAALHDMREVERKRDELAINESGQ